MDLAGLPCERGTQFFFPLEFDKEGFRLYEEQWKTLTHRLEDDKDLRDVYVIIHGWDKTPHAAESDYQDFICRFYEQGVRENWYYGREWASTRNAIILGVFWPSTIFPNWEDPSAIKPFTYFTIRDRADVLQKTALQQIFPAIADINEVRGVTGRLRLHLIGHSFGGRMIVKGLTTLMQENPDTAVKLFNGFSSVNLVLLLPAIAPDDIHQILSVRRHRFSLRHRGQSTIERLYPKSIGIIDSVHIYVIYSSNDWANRFLFRIGGLSGTDRMQCSVGGCGLPYAQDATVNQSGEIRLEDEEPWDWRYDNIWNIDASHVISSHGDIYKGRVSRLIWNLLHWPLDKRRWIQMFPPLSPISPSDE